MSEHARVTGPVTGGSKGWVFGGTTVDLVTVGYREDEYFLDGTATRYRPAEGTKLGFDGRWQVEPAGEAPYKTRIVVLRPVDPAAFNGTVLVCWNNVTAGYDGFSGDNAEILQGGYAHVAVTCQKAGAHGFDDAPPQGLTVWDPERYGSISIPSDDYSFDIFTQAGRAVGPDRARRPVDPMGGLDVQRLVAYGASQSAGRLGTYVNAIQPLAHVYDGFLLSLYFGAGSDLEVGDKVLNPLGAGPRPVPRRAANLVRDDLDVPVMVVNSELEATVCEPVRQPDTDRYRLWETAGTSHISRKGLLGVGAKSVRDLGVERPDIPGINDVSMAPVSEAATHHMQSWVSGGPPPPVQPRIEFAGDPPEVVRDEHRIACGGIRLPQVDVPVAHNGAITDEASGYGFLAGSHEPFPPEKLRALYPDAATYLARFEEATRAAEKAGVVLPRDVDGLIDDARAEFPL
ncbi:MAG: alpha/beta hydrolase domain-containing protein [Acidimicrobiia bacterium]